MKQHPPRRCTWMREWGLCPVTGKRCYPDRATARRAMRMIGSDNGGASLYRCKECGNYHTSSYPPNVARAIRYLQNSLRNDRRKAYKKRKRGL